jgi:cold-inducible RNA-binding protein
MPRFRALSENMNTKLFVGNLPPYITREIIKCAFAVHGSVSEVDLVTNRITARSRGFAFVTMSTEEGAQKAVEALNGSLNNGRYIDVQEAPTHGKTSPKTQAPRREFRKLY